MRRAIDETYRRRRIQVAYNEQHGIQPVGIVKAVKDITARVRQVAEAKGTYEAGKPIPPDELARLIKDLETQMKQAARDLEFEKAALLRDQVMELRGQQALQQPIEVATRGERHDRVTAVGGADPVSVLANQAATAAPVRSRGPRGYKGRGRR
jgi:excinuclease ABC subunit B